MTIDDAFQSSSAKWTEYTQKGSLLLLAVTASLMLAYRPRNGIMLAVVLALGTVVVPVGCVLARRLLEKAQHRKTEDRLMIHTQAYLRNQAPLAIAAPAGRGRAEESDIEILARAIDGRKLPRQDFRGSTGMASLLPVAGLVIFDALPRRYAIRTVYEKRFANLAAYQPVGDWEGGQSCPPVQAAP